MTETPETESSSSRDTIWGQLDAWARNLKPWQRFVLASAIRNGTLSEEQIEQAYSIFLHDNNLAQEPCHEIEIPDAISGRPLDALPGPIWLNRVGELQSVNALPCDGELTFSSALTVIYGGNGVGKSGFTRILSNVCFSRRQHQILPNIYEEELRDTDATITVADDSQSETSFNFEDAKKNEELKRIAVFDSAVSQIHLVDEEPLGFKPAGFDVFPEMARVYKEISERLNEDINKRDRNNPLVGSFVVPESKVSRFISELNADTDLAKLHQLAKFSGNEEARLAEIQRQIAEIRSNPVSTTIQQLKVTKSDIELLQSKLQDCSALLSEEKRKVYRVQQVSFEAKARALATQGSESFKQSFLNAVGTPEWERFLVAARDLAQREHTDYPLDTDHCLLCQRPLDAPSAALIRRFWGFLASAFRQDAETAGEVLNQSVGALKSLRLDFFSENTTIRERLSKINPAIVELTDTVLRAMDCDRQEIVTILERREGEIKKPTFEISKLSERLKRLVSQVDSDIQLLTRENAEDAIAQLETQRIELCHRQVLSQLRTGAERFVSDMAWIKRASDAPKRSLNPRALTDKENELFRTVIARSYRTQFTAECESLNCTVPVQLRMRGQRGQTVRSMRIQGEHKPIEILSEGEQRAVALADFLTEVSLNPASAGIVLDDPVTSQDHERKQQIAIRLASEAKDRQVIVFTHDLVFLTMLAASANEQKIDLLTHWIQKHADGTPGQISLNDCPAGTPQYRNTNVAKKTLEEAKVAKGSNQLELVRRGMGELRRTTEEVIPHILLKQVVTRWSDRIIVTALRKIKWDNQLIDEFIQVYEELSAIIEGHSHTEERAGGFPEPKNLEEMIESVDELIKKARSER